MKINMRKAQIFADLLSEDLAAVLQEAWDAMAEHPASKRAKMFRVAFLGPRSRIAKACRLHPDPEFRRLAPWAVRKVVNRFLERKT